MPPGRRRGRECGPGAVATQPVRRSPGDRAAPRRSDGGRDAGRIARRYRFLRRRRACVRRRRDRARRSGAGGGGVRLRSGGRQRRSRTAPAAAALAADRRPVDFHRGGNGGDGRGPAGHHAVNDGPSMIANGAKKPKDPGSGEWHEVPVAMIGGLPIAVISRMECARLMIDAAMARRGAAQPALVFTSANGQVLSMCEADDDIRALFFASDLINADGMPLVFASQFLSDHKLPERVATTDLVYEVAEIAQGCGATFYLLRAATGVIERAAQHLHELYPRLQIVGRRSGYFGADDEADAIAAINDARPDILSLRRR